VREFLEAALTPELRRAGGTMTSVYADPAVSLGWQRILYAKGWVAPAWPVEFGGCGWSVSRRAIFAAELVLAGAPPLSPARSTPGRTRSSATSWPRRSSASDRRNRCGRPDDRLAEHAETRFTSPTHACK
jgi:alkylation response protein AidB-like acyl-CoA dehydrogenase